MKTVLMSIFSFVVLTMSGFAQLETGTWIGGVNGNFSFVKSSSTNHTLNWSFNPYGMYLLSKNLALGLALDNRFSHVKIEYQAGNEIISDKWGYYNLQFAPTIRKYFGNGKFRPFIGLSTGFLLSLSGYNGDADSQSNLQSDFGFFVAPEAGVSWWLNDKLFLDLKASYNLIDTYHAPSYNSFDVKFGLGFKFGK